MRALIHYFLPHNVTFLHFFLLHEEMGTENERSLHKMLSRSDELNREISGLHHKLSLLIATDKGITRGNIEELYLYLKEHVANGVDLTSITEELHDHVYSLVSSSKAGEVISLLLDMTIYEDEQLMLKRKIFTFISTSAGAPQTEAEQAEVFQEIEMNLASESKAMFNGDFASPAKQTTLDEEFAYAADEKQASSAAEADKKSTVEESAELAKADSKEDIADSKEDIADSKEDTADSKESKESVVEAAGADSAQTTDETLSATSLATSESKEVLTADSKDSKEPVLAASTAETDQGSETAQSKQALDNSESKEAQAVQALTSGSKGTDINDAKNASEAGDKNSEGNGDSRNASMSDALFSADPKNAAAAAAASDRNDSKLPPIKLEAKPDLVEENIKNLKDKHKQALTNLQNIVEAEKLKKMKALEDRLLLRKMQLADRKKAADSVGADAETEQRLITAIKDEIGEIQTEIEETKVEFQKTKEGTK